MICSLQSDISDVQIWLQDHQSVPHASEPAVKWPVMLVCPKADTKSWATHSFHHLRVAVKSETTFSK